MSWCKTLIQGTINAINAKKEVKAPGRCGIHAEIWKHGSMELASRLHKLVLQIRETEVIPEGKMLSNIVPVSRTIEVIISSQYLERSRRRYSSSNTVLGLTLCNTLKWNNNIKEIVTKALKCLYILRVLKRAWIPSSYFLNVYCALIRWFLEVLCHVVRHLSVYLSDKQVQKRALHILFPNTHYNVALDAWRIDLCFRVWHSIRDHPESRLLFI